MRSKTSTNVVGKVIIPEGTWLTGPIELLSNVNLYTERNALVLFTGDFEAYPIIDTSFEGLETRRCQSPISARNAENIAVTGYGTFDGNGDCWRPVKKEKLLHSGRNWSIRAVSWMRNRRYGIPPQVR